ncbi:TIR domain-containing protein [Geodermatophilus sp. SYSU D00697]
MISAARGGAVARVFISHATEDTTLAGDVQRWLTADGHETFLDRDARDGVRLGDEWEQRLYERLRWADAMVCVMTPAYVASTWCTAEVGIARSQGVRLLPVRTDPRISHPLLHSVQQVDLTAGAAGARAALAAALQLVDVVGGLGWSDDREPYPGLRPFSSDLRRVFFGRGAEIEQLASLLRSPAHHAETAVLLVVGPSGCGKSSLVRAGLLPVMGEEPDWWTVPPMLPGTDPVGALARELAGAARELGLGWSVADVRDRLDERGLRELVDEVLLAVPGPRRRHVLLVVDQFEELLTQATAAQRAHFAGVLEPALAGSVTVVATLRPEFLDRLLVDPGLATLPTHPYTLRPLRAEALRDVVGGPARVAGIGIDDGLVSRVVADTDGGEALPLLAYTLAELAHGVRRGGRLLMSRYEQLGGVQGAISRQADAALGEAQETGRRDGHQVIKELLRLVTVDEQGRPTRWRVSRADLPATVVDELEPFVARRLLTTDRHDGDTVLGVAHEAFLSAWPPLAAAIEGAAAALRARRQIEQAAAVWAGGGRDPVRLWERGQLASALSDTGAHMRGSGRLAQRSAQTPGGVARHRPHWPMGRRVLVTDRVDLSPTAREFLTASTRRDRFRRRRATTVLSLLLGIAVFAAGVAYVQQRTATHQQTVATARQLAATAVSIEDTHLDLAQLLAVEGYRRNPDTQTRAALFSATTASPRLVRYLHADAEVSVVAASRDGAVLVAGTESGRLHRWTLGDPGRAQEVARLSGEVTSVGVSADGTVVAATDGSQVAIWDAQGGGASSWVPSEPGMSPVAVGISPAGRWLAVAGRHASDQFGSPPTLTVEDLLTHQSTVTVLATGATDLVFPDESQLVAVDMAHGTWQRLGLSPLTTVTTSGQSLTGAHEYAAAISSDGGYFTWTNASREIPVWTTATAADSDRPDLVAVAPGRSPEALAVSPGGGMIAVADAGAVYLSRTGASSAASVALDVLTGNSSVNPDGLVFVGDHGEALASASGNSLALWDLDQLGRIGKALPVPVPAACNACPGPEVLVSPDGRGAAVIDGSDATLAVAAGPLRADPSSRSLRFLWLSGVPKPFGAVHWSEDSAKLLVQVPDDATVRVTVEAPDGQVVQTVPAPSGDDPVSLPLLRPGDPEIVLVPPDGRSADGVTSAMTRARDLLDEALQAYPDERAQAARMVFDASVSRAASVVTSWTAEGDLNSDVWLVDVGRGAVDVVPVGDAVGVAFTRDRLLVSRGDGPLEIRDTSGRRVLATAPGGGADTQALAGAVGSNLAARLRQDGTIVLLDASRGAVLGSLGEPSPVHYGLAPGLAFTPDGRYLLVALPYEASVAGTGELRQYVTASDAWVRIACETAGRVMTPTEWRQFVDMAVPTDLGCGEPS